MQRAEHMSEPSITLSRAQHHAILAAKIARSSALTGSVSGASQRYTGHESIAVSLFDPA